MAMLDTLDEKAAARQRPELLQRSHDERQPRLSVETAAKLKAMGCGSVSVDAKRQRLRRSGGGRKRTIDKDTTLLTDLEALVDPAARGNPESPLIWTCKSLRALTEELKARGHTVSHVLVRDLLKRHGYSLQANAKTLEGVKPPDRIAQLEYINECAMAALAEGEPVISVETRTEERLGPQQDKGREWPPQGEPVAARIHDLVAPEGGRAYPHGVFAAGEDSAWFSAGPDQDTPILAVETIRRWWCNLGQDGYPQAKALTITANGGSHGYRVQLWKRALQKLADDLGMTVRVCHLPPATSKWNKIEHRLFSFIHLNWRGQPLASHEVIVQLIAAATARPGWLPDAELDNPAHRQGAPVSAEEPVRTRLHRGRFHDVWNYRIRPA